MKRAMFLLGALGLAAVMLQAQEVVSSGGSHASGANVSLSWTIGEPVVSTLSTGGYILTQGFHQSRLSATAIEHTPIPGFNLLVYPNPFLYVLHLSVEEGDFSRLDYQLLTVDGKSLLTKPIKSKVSDIDMQAYPAANYLLLVRQQSGRVLKTFRLVKNN
jgi:hypothetical protein